jgi:hypothetical protein
MFVVGSGGAGYIRGLIVSRNAERRQIMPLFKIIQEVKVVWPDLYSSRSRAVGVVDFGMSATQAGYDEYGYNQRATVRITYRLLAQDVMARQHFPRRWPLLRVLCEVWCEVSCEELRGILKAQSKSEGRI